MLQAPTPLLDEPVLRVPDPDGLAGPFRTQEPFPHLVLDDVLSVDPSLIVTEFPEASWSGWTRYRDQYQHGKLICSDVAAMPDGIRTLVQDLSAPAFLEFLEAITGIGGLIPDPYLEGGGMHASGPGATLTPHTDFHVYVRLGLFRRVNVLLYLNPGWESDDGGALELFGNDYNQPARSLDPIFGRMVIFRTDDQSPHGFTQPVADDRYRRSLALYYYTATESEGFAGDTNTYWKTHGETTTPRRVRLAAYRALLLGSRSFSMLAHRCNPNLGSRVRPEGPTT
jgi:hypothetical protein